ncbi:phospholipid transfer protein C2CD2L isoform X2 [Cylas formicarius]|uniref:phospholipid transfer protein C2CD2L isoform X2 n=1 Tax=Cylas formicarius TaxID=197179 RepID=UPI0029583E39|nr:phospholipid transfer protein C2CD2L isoform X2 [Cylas formicarius]
MDLAEAVEDLICTFDGYADTTMDTIAMFLFGWILAALFVLWLGKLVYERFVSKKTKNKLEFLTSSSTGVKSEPGGVADVVDAAKKPTIVPKASGAYVPPTPPVRKRLTRQSPVPENRKPRFVPAPQCTGPDNVVVLWVNEVFQWLYNDLVIVNELLQVWIDALNEYTKKSVAEQGIGVELIRILPETHPPTLTNIFAEADSKDDVTITCDCEATPAFQLKSFRQKGDKVETSHYRVNVNRFRARLNIYAVTEKLQAEVKCDGWPEIKVALAPVGNIKNNLDETQLQEVISEIVVTALRNAEVHLNLAQYPTSPRLIRHIEMPSRILPVHYDGMSNAYSSTPNHTAYNTAPLQGDKRLLVKIIRANELGGAQGCVEPFCVVEMDEPPQKNQTSIQRNTNAPYWDEHFLFDLSPHTAELLFEIYDHSVKPHRFLGLAIVGVEELLINPAQRQIILLQSRPYESDKVSGTLTIEFMFIESADVPNKSHTQPYKIKEAIRTPSPSPTRPRAPTPTKFYTENLTNGSHPVSDFDRNRHTLSPNRNTLVIQGVQRQPSQRLVKVELDNGNWKEVERVELDSSERFIAEEVKNVHVAKLNEQASKENGVAGAVEANGTTNGNDKNASKSDGSGSKPGDISTTATHQTQQNQSDYDFRGRPRKRRDFFGTIKRRLGKSKNRSKSAGPENDVGRDDSLNRSVSADRGHNHDESYRLNVPLGRSTEETSRRSSLSEASGLSSASTRTYVNEASTLVLETIENGIKKHYLVPLSLAQKSRWKKKGVKLHIFNDHTFVAKHLQGGTVCQVCAKTIARRFGKQGYECRDCMLKCHKQCHVKVNDNCPSSTIHNIELSMLPVLSE